MKTLTIVSLIIGAVMCLFAIIVIFFILNESRPFKKSNESDAANIYNYSKTTKKNL